MNWMWGNVLRNTPGTILCHVGCICSSISSINTIPAPSNGFVCTIDTKKHGAFPLQINGLEALKILCFYMAYGHFQTPRFYATNRYRPVICSICLQYTRIAWF